MARRRLLNLAVLLLGLSAYSLGCGGSSEQAATTDESVRTTLIAGSPKEPNLPLPKGAPPTHLVVKDLKAGWGIEARRGDEVMTKQVARFVTGRFLESSWVQNGQPFTFQLGAEEASPGWEKGIPGMRVGGVRKLVVPPDEGSRYRPVIGEGKPDDTLVYAVELIGVMPPHLAARKEPKVAPLQGAPPDQLEVRELIKGTGAAAKNGDLLTVEYVGIRCDGRPFTNSWKRAKPFQFELGSDSVFTNAGWEKGLRGMRVGARRELIIPPKLLGQSGSGPQGDGLIYVIDLMGIAEKEPRRR
jgi:peptidylprolyl isomerase